MMMMMMMIFGCPKILVLSTSLLLLPITNSWFQLELTVHTYLCKQKPSTLHLEFLLLSLLSEWRSSTAILHLITPPFIPVTPPHCSPPMALSFSSVLYVLTFIWCSRNNHLLVWHIPTLMYALGNCESMRKPMAPRGNKILKSKKSRFCFFKKKGDV